jgi:hypothetical protein
VECEAITLAEMNGKSAYVKRECLATELYLSTVSNRNDMRIIYCCVFDSTASGLDSTSN